MSIRSRALRKVKPPVAVDAVICVDDLKKIVAAATPIIEDWLDNADQLAAFRETADEKNLDWDLIQKLLIALVRDERDENGGQRLNKLAAGIDAKLLSVISAAFCERKPISTELRRFIFERDGGKCVYCGRGDGPHHLDHVKPVSRRGLSVAENLVLACAPCNLSKGSKTLDEWSAHRAARAS